MQHGSPLRPRPVSVRRTVRQRAHASDFPIVGMGASAGGFEAFKQLLEKLPSDTGMAFILVQHLDPTHESKLTDLLSHTTALPLLEARNGTVVKPDHAYVIMPNTNMVIRRRTLKVTPRATTGRNLPVDLFFRSLAEDQGRQAIGIVLSGTANDGAGGIQAIKVAGGITFAQDEETAKYPGMPRSAAATGCVDFVLPPAAIARELAHIGSHPYTNPLTANLTLEGDKLMAVFRILRARTGTDFTHYKMATIERRIQRRMALQRLQRLKEYVQILQDQPGEVEALYADLLINVTGFFRDAEVFQALKKKVFPRLVSGRTQADPIRIWVPGCSTGEEAYSLAIRLLEYLGTNSDAIPIQIFGTDISEKALDKARAGFYPESIEADLSPAQLRRFFMRATGGYRVSKAVRELCVFAPHDLIRDPPFSNLDLISCRNVLIYLGPLLQKRILPIFHYALKPGGFLLLGKSETIHGFADFFAVVDKKNRVYSPKEATPRTSFAFEPTKRPQLPATASPEAASPGRNVPDVRKEADRLLVGRFAPPSVLVNEALEVLQFRGHTGPFVEHEAGAATLHLLRMVREDLAMELRSAINRARKQGSPVHGKATGPRTAGGCATVNLEVIPMRLGRLNERHYLILFESVAEPAGRQPGILPEPPPVDRRESVIRLKQELAATRESQREIVEELETANEELKAVNEEIQSSNEELQSTNEELETAKEELQSANEELSTVNEELQTRGAELGQLNDDLLNLLDSVNIPILVLSSDLRIRRFTPMAEKVLGLLPADIGREITGLRLPLNLPNLERLITTAMEDLCVKQRDVQHRDGHWHALQARPYRTADNRIDGAVIALWDIDASKLALQEVRAARSYSEAIVQAVISPLLVLNGEMRIQVANKEFCLLFKVSKHTTEGRSIFELGKGQWNQPEVRKLLKKVLSRNVRVDGFRMAGSFPHIGQRTMLLNIHRMMDAISGKPLLLLALEDITARERIEAELRESEARFRIIFDAAADGLFLHDRISRRFYLANKACLRMLGYSLAEFRALDLKDLHLKEDLPFISSEFARFGLSEEALRVDVRFRRKDGSILLTELNPTPVRLEGRDYVLVAIRDITERKRMEAEILCACEAERQRIASDLHDGPNQSLPAIGYLLSAIQTRLARKSDPEAVPLKKIIRLIEGETQRIHNISRGMFPVELQRGGIASALSELANHVQSLFGISCRVTGLTDINLTDEHVARQLYRIAQEAVYNAARHARSKKILIRLAHREDQILLTIRDDGTGLCRTTGEQTGMGLRIMKYRADMIGAALTLKSERGRGTLLTCLVSPLTHHRKEAEP